jgi:hypothetical protein
MTRLTRIEVNCETGEKTIVELTDEEMAQLEADRIAAEEQRAAAEAEAAVKAEAKASAEAKLAALGLTSEEIAALSK